MSDVVSNGLLTAEEAGKLGADRVCIVVDEDMARALCRLRDVLGFPMGALLSTALRQVIDTFLPLADLHEQGKLTADSLPEFMKNLEASFLRAEVARARLDKKVTELEKQKKSELKSKG